MGAGRAPRLVNAIAEALRSAGATEEIITALMNAGGTFEHVPRSKGGRPRKHFADRASTAVERAQASRARRNVAKPVAKPTPEVSQHGPDVAKHPLEVLQPSLPYRLAIVRERIGFVAPGKLDDAADLAPIVALINQGCDLELDVLPVVATRVSDLPRPLKNWGAPWLVREICAGRASLIAGRSAMPKIDFAAVPERKGSG
jgi:hypothetical protein